MANPTDECVGSVEAGFVSVFARQKHFPTGVVYRAVITRSASDKAEREIEIGEESLEALIAHLRDAQRAIKRQRLRNNAA